MSEATDILNRVQNGEAQAAGGLLPLVYEELRKLAAHKLAQEQAARELEVSVSTAERLWAYARAWLFREVRKGPSPGMG